MTATDFLFLSLGFVILAIAAYLFIGLALLVTDEITRILRRR